MSEDKCTCGEGGAEEQFCPYSEEIHGEESVCDCCEYCYNQCMMDI